MLVQTLPQEAPSLSLGLRAPKLPTLVLLGVLAVLLAWAAGFRWFGLGRDFFEYLSFYLTVTPYFLSGYSRFEWGFEASAWLFGSVFGLPYEVFAFVLVAIALGIKFYLFTKYLESPWLAIIAYLLMFYAIHEYTQIRAAVAIAFGYLGVHQFVERRHFAAALSMLVAFLFHASLVLIALVALGVKLVPRRFFLPIVLAGAVIGGLFFAQVEALIRIAFSDFNPLVSYYIDNLSNAGEINIFSLTNLIIMLTLAFCAVAGYIQRSDYHYLFFAFGVAAFVWLFLFRGSPVLALRTAEMLFVGLIFLVYRRPLTIETAIPQGLLIAAGLWSTYSSIREGVLSL